MKKIYKIILVSFLVYAIFFCRSSDICYRINSSGNKEFNFVVLFIEGFIKPFKSVYSILIKNGLWNAYKYVKSDVYNLANPYSVFAIVYSIFKIIDRNKILKINL